MGLLDKAMTALFGKRGDDVESEPMERQGDFDVEEILMLRERLTEKGFSPRQLDDFILESGGYTDDLDLFRYFQLVQESKFDDIATVAIEAEGFLVKATLKSILKQIGDPAGEGPLEEHDLSFFNEAFKARRMALAIEVAEGIGPLVSQREIQVFEGLVRACMHHKNKLVAVYCPDIEQIPSELERNLSPVSIKRMA